MHSFRDYIQKFVALPAEEWRAIEGKISCSRFPTGSLILEEGQICRNIYFIERGLLRFFVWKDGVDVSKFFTQAPYCFTSQKSFSREIPAQENIETLEESVIYSIKREDAYQLLENKSWSDFIRMLIQEVQNNTEDILDQLQNETAEERYRKMLQEEPELIQRISLKHLASYLGIAPQSLSRIRKKITKE